MEVIIEQLGTTHNVLDRQKFKQNDISIGRAYYNDLILTDEHIDGVHANLQQDDEGGWWLIDNQSLNGVKKHKSKQRLERQRVQSGDIYLIGRNKIRVLFGSHPVPATVKIRLSEVFLLWLGRLPVLLALTFGYIIVKLLDVYSNSVNELNWNTVISNNLQSSLGFVGLALVVYLLSILFKRGGNFLSHLGVLMLVFFVSTLFDFGIELFKFNTSSRFDGLSSFLQQGCDYFVLFLYFWCILYLAFHISLQRRTIMSLALISVMVGIQWLNRDRFDDFFALSIDSDETMLPPVLLLKKPVDSIQYFDQAFDVFDDVEAEKKKREEQ